MSASSKGGSLGEETFIDGQASLIIIALHHVPTKKAMIICVMRIVLLQGHFSQVMIN
jgi:hypothetical protein